MNDTELRRCLIDTGKKLIEMGLVVRTWGNVSLRYDADSMVISPSGMSYDDISTEDIPQVALNTGEYIGRCKPSSEKLVHMAAYIKRDYAKAVVHTHQIYATAVGLVFEDGIIPTGKYIEGNRNNPKIIGLNTDEEKLLGKIAVAGYGLPGTDELRYQVEKALDLGADVIMMKHHGVMMLGGSMEEALEKAEVLERVCKRYVEGILSFDEHRIADKAVYAQLDDMAQMIGHTLPVIDTNDSKIIESIDELPAYINREGQIIIRIQDESDKEAMKILIDKAILCSRLTDKLKVNAELSKADCDMMRDNYINNYSKLIKK